MSKPVLTTEQVTELMRDDLKSLKRVVEMVRANAPAIALLAQRHSEGKISDRSALAFAALCWSVLGIWSEDMQEALDKLDAGEVSAVAIREDDLPNNDSTRH